MEESKTGMANLFVSSQGRAGIQAIAMMIGNYKRGQQEDIAKKYNIKHLYCRLEGTKLVPIKYHPNGGEWHTAFRWMPSGKGILIDEFGVCRGHFNSITATSPTLKKMGKVTSIRPIWLWPKSAKKARAAFCKRRLGGALKAASSIKGDVPWLFEELTAFGEAQVKLMEEALEEGNVLGAATWAQRLALEWRGTPPATAAKLIQQKIRNTPQIKIVLQAQKTLAKCELAIENYQISAKSSLKKWYQRIDRIKKKHEGTFVAKKAEQVRLWLDKNHKCKKCGATIFPIKLHSCEDG